MLCCLGLFVGFAIGSMAGGPWILIAPIIGFGLGFLGDMKIMHGNHGRRSRFIRGHGGSEYAYDGKAEDADDPVYRMKV